MITNLQAREYKHTTINLDDKEFNTSYSSIG